MLELKLLGSPQILLAGRPVSGLAAAKSQALLFYLAVTGRPQSRLALAGLLWPDKRETDALANLRQALYHLRNTLPDYFEINRLTVAFNATLPYHIDAILFEKEVDETNALATRQAVVDRYNGEFLAGFYVDEAQPFDEWAVVMRERLHHLATTTLHQLVTHFVAHQETEPGLRYTNQWLTLEPWDEQAHRYKLRFLAWDGQRQAALDHYERCRQLLAEELNALPDAETVALVEQIRTGKLDKETRRPEDKEHGVASVSVLPSLPVSLSSYHDWGEAPAPTAFYGRAVERALIAQWLGEDRCRLVAILGMGGMGKTALAVQVAHQMAPHFDVVIWRSLLNAPPLSELLSTWLQLLAPEQLGKAPASLDAQLARLFDYLRQRRCLLILDNGESILQTDARAGLYRPGYEAYGQLLRRVGAGDHQSTLLLTSREQPQGVDLLPRATGLVQVLRLSGLEADSGQALLQSCGLTSITSEAEQMISRYSGNPLALQIVAQVVADLFDRDLTAFLNQEALIFDDIRDVLDQQWARLTLLERDLLLWLAIEREIVGLETLRNALVSGSTGSALLEALRSLQRRSLIEQRGTAFTLQNVVTEYLTERLIDTITAEVVDDSWLRFHSHALIRTQAKEYVRESQIRMILAPIATHLLARLGRVGLAQQLRAGLAAQRQAAPRQPSYAGGNAVNLLIHLGYDLQGYDFSHLCLWQANFQNVRLPAVNLTQADLRGVLFADPFHGQHTLAWSGDGALLAVAGSDGHIHLWRTADLQLAAICPGHERYVYKLAFSPDSRLLASGSADCTVGVWDVENYQLFAILRGHTRAFQTLAWSHDSRLLISGSLDGAIGIWRLRGELVAMLPGHSDSVQALALNPAGTILASAGSDRALRFWDWAALLRAEGTAAAALHTLAHAEKLTAIAWSPDGRLLACGGVGAAIYIWAAATGQLQQTLPSNAYVVRYLRFSPDGALLAAGSGTDVQIWAVGAWLPRAKIVGGGHEINEIQWSPDSKQVAGVAWDVVRLWDVQTGQLVSTLRGYCDEVLSVSFSADGRRAASSHTDEAIRIWDTTTWQVCAMLCGHKGLTRDIRFSPDGATLVSAGYDQTVRLWDSQSGQQQRLLRGHSDRIASLAMSADGRLFATGSADRSVWLWDRQPCQVRHRLYGHSEVIQGLAFSPDSRLLATGAEDAIIRLWDTASGEPLRTLTGHTAEVHSLVFDPTGAVLASGSADETIGMWDVHTGQRLRSLTGHTAIVCELALSPDGAILASCGAADQTVRLWDFATGALLHVLQHGDWVVTSAFSPDGRTLLSGCENGQLRLWDVQTGQCLRVFRAPGPYAGMNITGVTGITEAQKAAIKTLGAIDHAPTLSLDAVATSDPIHPLA